MVDCTKDINEVIKLHKEIKELKKKDKGLCDFGVFLFSLIVALFIHILLLAV